MWCLDCDSPGSPTDKVLRYAAKCKHTLCNACITKMICNPLHRKCPICGVEQTKKQLRMYELVERRKKVKGIPIGGLPSPVPQIGDQPQEGVILVDIDQPSPPTTAPGLQPETANLGKREFRICIPSEQSDVEEVDREKLFLHPHKKRRISAAKKKRRATGKNPTNQAAIGATLPKTLKKFSSTTLKKAVVIKSVSVPHRQYTTRSLQKSVESASKNLHAPSRSNQQEHLVARLQFRENVFEFFQPK